MGVEFHRRLHRDQRQQLEQMVRHHVAQRAGRVVKVAAMPDAEFFIDGDLDVVDMVAVPDRLEHAVGEAQYQDVLHRLLAEIMIDPIDLVLFNQLEQFTVERFAEARSVPNGFSTTSRRHAPFSASMPVRPSSRLIGRNALGGVAR